MSGGRSNRVCGFELEHVVGLNFEAAPIETRIPFQMIKKWATRNSEFRPSRTMSESDIEFDSDFPTFDFNVKMPLPVIVGRIAATVPSYLQLIIESGPGPQAAVRVTFRAQPESPRPNSESRGRPGLTTVAAARTDELGRRPSHVPSHGPRRQLGPAVWQNIRVFCPSRPSLIDHCNQLDHD